MKKETLRIVPKRLKPRSGVQPTRVERDQTVYSRTVKHRGQAGLEEDSHAVATISCRHSMRISVAAFIG
ncbi:hypothetical protein [Acidithiobacillus ferriphilus]|jgi:hypothetical protein|uniref:hypothetical protein n=1 Tax=Acidithiobacillus ferriphilus TaxID=1689834 RepID=UPI0024331EB5|nr:hypothetical protein [Acidithiobacillus ferriphilus]MBW9254096.1 hypothetical protein [Acidithiobacillus ferriphilus]